MKPYIEIENVMSQSQKSSRPRDQNYCLHKIPIKWTIMNITFIQKKNGSIMITMSKWSFKVTVSLCTPAVQTFGIIIVFWCLIVKTPKKVWKLQVLQIQYWTINHLCSIISLNGGFLITKSPRELRPKLMLKCTFPRPVLRYMWTYTFMVI